MFRPEGSSRRAEAPIARPTSENIDDAVIKQKMNREMSPIGYESTKNEIMGWAAGDNDETRAEYYPGWIDQDFSELLARLERMESAK